MGKKKFLDKRNSATFRLFSRDSSDPNSHGDSSIDGVFIRVDKNSYSFNGIFDHDDAVSPHKELPSNDSNSIFADAVDDDSDEDDFLPDIQDLRSQIQTTAPLPDNMRREILELGFPDDGYNYLLHMREIRNSGGGSSFYHNPKAKLDRVPNDVKAYDASRLRVVSEVEDYANPSLMYSVASRTVGARIQRVVDPDVAALLDDSDRSRFESDIEDLEEDFVVQANIPEEGEGEAIEDEEVDVKEPRLEENGRKCWVPIDDDALEEQEISADCEGNQLGVEKERILRPLDKQFELLALQEYNSDDDESVATEEGESLAAKLNHTLKDYKVDDLDFAEKYKVPGDFKDEGSSGEEEPGALAEVIRKCAEYAEMYEHESQEDGDTMLAEDSSDESEVADCETIVSTYSNLDNHPGKIEAPGRPKKKPTEAFPSGPLGAQNSHVISLRGKEKLPVDFLPFGKRTIVADEKKRVPNPVVESQKKRGCGKEMKEEKKERKATVKAEKREARKAKKELKGLYKCVAELAQKVAAVSGPSAIHLM